MQWEVEKGCGAVVSARQPSFPTSKGALLHRRMTGREKKVTFDRPTRLPRRRIIRLWMPEFVDLKNHGCLRRGILQGLLGLRGLMTHDPSLRRDFYTKPSVKSNYHPRCLPRGDEEHHRSAGPETRTVRRSAPRAEVEPQRGIQEPPRPPRTASRRHSRRAPLSSPASRVNRQQKNRRAKPRLNAVQRYPSRSG